MSEPVANDWTFIASRLREIRKEADERLGATEPSPVDAAIKAPEPDADQADDLFNISDFGVY